MIKVNIISNRQNLKKFSIKSTNLIEKKINKINKRYKKYKNKDVFFTLLLSEDSEIKKLNNNFRKKNRTTDVLSFPFHEKKELHKKLVKDREIYLGDVIVNLNKIKGKMNFFLELDKLWIHGLVHLFGYDHKNNVDFMRMTRIEKKFLSYIK